MKLEMNRNTVASLMKFVERNKNTQKVYTINFASETSIFPLYFHPISIPQSSDKLLEVNISTDILI